MDGGGRIGRIELVGWVMLVESRCRVLGGCLVEWMEAGGCL